MQQQRQEDMKKPRSQEHAALCLLIWSCLECALSDFLEVQPTFPGEETSTETFRRGAANGTTAQSNLSGIPQCVCPASGLQLKTLFSALHITAHRACFEMHN